jgi:NAD(P)-dependent dehydrogenase (short-subunit alcohol dehydrogenase family)
LYATVKQQKSRINILFANAGLWEFGPLAAITEAHFDKIFSVNVKGCSQYKKRFRCFRTTSCIHWGRDGRWVRSRPPAASTMVRVPAIYGENVKKRRFLL